MRVSNEMVNKQFIESVELIPFLSFGHPVIKWYCTEQVSASLLGERKKKKNVLKNNKVI